MASGVPVVVSRSSSLPEVVGQAASMVDAESVEELSEAMSEPLLDEGIRARMVAEGLEQAQHFTWEEAARKMLSVYRRIGTDL